MADVNQFNCTCGIVTEPELSYIPNGTALCRFRVGIEDYKGKSQYLTVKAWGKTADTMNQYLKVGKKVFLTGRLSVETWETNDGETKTDVVIYVDNFTFLSGGGNGNGKDNKDNNRNSNKNKVKEKPTSEITDKSRTPVTAGISLDSDEDIPF